MRGNQTITVLRASVSEDEYGNDTPNWATATETEVRRCSLQPVEGDEQTVGRTVVVSRWRLRAPLGTDLLSSDRVRHRDVTYEVDGDVQVWEGLHGYVSTLLRKGA